MNRRGYAIMADALIALVFMLIIFSAVFSIQLSRTSKSELLSFKELHYLSEDALDTLNKKGVLDNISTLWAQNPTAGSKEMNDANITARSYLERMLPPNVGYCLVIEEGASTYVIASSTSSRPLLDESTTQTHSTRLLVGFNSTSPTYGKVARAQINERARPTIRYSVGYGNVFDSAEGCIWNINFQNGLKTIRIPSTYAGSSVCNYTNASVVVSDDAISDAVFRLLSGLDTDQDHRVDVLFDTDNMEFEAVSIDGVRSLWGPIRLKLIVWM